MKLSNETETVEYKKTTGELKEGVISIVSILNKHNGGKLYFGVKPDGTIVGQGVSDKTLRDISQAIYNHIEPQIFPDIRSVVIDNKNCILVTFEGDNVPYFAYGRAYMRVADEDRVMSPQELESFYKRKLEYTEKWDSGTSENTIDNVSEKLLSKYIKKANAAGRLDYEYTNKRDILQKLELLQNDNLTNAAEVMFCENVNLEMQMAIFASNERLTFTDIQCEKGTLNQLVEIAEKYIKNNIHWRVEFNSGLQRDEIPEIPINAIREALYNSFCHRDFRISQSNEVTIFKNRVEIYNPGTFPDGLTPQNFVDGIERSIRRNPLLAQILYYSKDIEKFGTGLRRIITACEEANVKVEFQMLKMGFSVIFYRSETSMTDKVTDKMTDKSVIEDKISIIIEYLKANEFISNSTAREMLSVSDSTVRRLLNSMTDKGYIVAEGERKGRIYKLKRD